jgi:iron complex transport system substrate-binding protein
MIRAAAAGGGALIALASAGAAAADGERVLSIGGSVTEIVYALGQGDRLIGRDSTSTFPPEALALPDLGYMRALSPEGVLSVGPDLILADADSGPPEAVAAIEAASVAFVEVPSDESAAGVGKKIRTVAQALGVDDAGEALAERVEGEIRRAEAAAAVPERRRAIFLLSVEGGRLMAAGAGTGADAMLGLAGAENALAGFEGYKPVSAEAVLAAAPEVVVMMDRGDGHAAAPEQVFALPGLAGTPAAAAGALVRIDGLFLLGFGPRTAAAVDALHRALYPDAG